MAYPVGMITRAVTFAAFFDADGGPLDLTVRVEPARSFIWAATGEAFLRIPVEGRADGAPITIELPVPGQTGFVDGAGNTISDWTYTATYALPASATPVPKVTFYLPDAPDPLVIAPNLSTHVDGGIVNVPYPVEGPPGPPGSSGGTATWGGITGTLTDQTDLQSALDNKQPAGSYAAAVHTHAKSEVGLGNVDNTADSAKPVSTAQQTALNLKANAASPAFTGTPTGLVKAHVGLSNVDNTADSAKPVSTAQQTALNLKANLASPALTGNPTAPTQTAGNNTTRLATTAFVTSAVAAVPGGGGGAPSAFYTMPIASGRVRVGAMMIPNSPWKFVDAGRVYFYPVYYDATFGVANIGFALRGAAAGGSGRQLVLRRKLGQLGRCLLRPG